MILALQMKDRSNNLGFMKFIAAIFVLVHHSYALTDNQDSLIGLITEHQLDFGTLSVSLFFLFSGLFIAKSVEQLQTPQRYFKARFIRIWPALSAVVCLSIIMGAFISSLSLYDYFTDRVTWKYFMNAFFVLQHSLPGVFEDNVYGNAVNGALWTMPVEVLCYIACYVIFQGGFLKKKKILVVMVLYFAFAASGYYLFTLLKVGLLTAALRPCYFFLLGNVLYVYREKVMIDMRLFWAAVCGMAVSLALSLPGLAIWVFYPYIILYLAFMGRQCGRAVSVLGRYSYTIYLCGFPIQQLLIWWAGGDMNTYVNIALSIVCTMAVGVLLYHCIEKLAVMGRKKGAGGIELD